MNPDLNLAKPKLRSRCYSPHSFNKLKLNLPEPCRCDGTFALLHINIRSLKHNLDDFQVHLSDELQYRFSVIGITETKITDPNFLGFNPNIACVASVPVRQKSFQTIFCKLAARKLGQETEGTLARRPPIFKNPFAHERGLLIGAAQSQ